MAIEATMWKLKRKKPGTGTTVETDEPDSRHRDCFSKMCA